MTELLYNPDCWDWSIERRESHLRVVAPLYWVGSNKFKENWIMQIMEDLTPIKFIQTVSGNLSVGRDGVTKIVPYYENGYLLWFAVYEDNEIVRRINGAAVEYISYR